MLALPLLYFERLGRLTDSVWRNFNLSMPKPFENKVGFKAGFGS